MLAIAAVLLLNHSFLPHLPINCYISFHPLIFYVKSNNNFFYWYPLSSIILNDFNCLPRTSNSIALKHALQIETSGKIYFDVRRRKYDGPHSFTL